MRTIKRVLETKAPDVWHVKPNDSVFDALKLMAEKDVGALLVMDNEQLVGLISERDYARKMILTGRSSPQTPVEQIMTKAVLSVPPEQDVDECLAFMTEKRIRHLPVIGSDGLIGIISMGDLVKTIITDQKVKIEQLESYISSG